MSRKIRSVRCVLQRYRSFKSLCDLKLCSNAAQQEKFAHPVSRHAPLFNTPNLAIYYERKMRAGADLFHADLFALGLLWRLRYQRTLEISHGLPQSLLILNQRNAHISLAVLAEGAARR